MNYKPIFFNMSSEELQKHIEILRKYSFQNAPLKPLESPDTERPAKTWVDVVGREEHEELLNDPKRCAELGLDIFYERMVYLHRYGNLLTEEERQLERKRLGKDESKG